MQSEIRFKDKWKQFNTIGTNFNESVNDEINFNKTDDIILEESDGEENENETANSPSPNLGEAVDINDI